MTTNALKQNHIGLMVKMILALILLLSIFSVFQQTVHATSNGQKLQFNEAAYTVNEDVGYISIPINRLGGKENVVGVTYCTCADTAVAPADFIHSSGTMIFYNNENETAKSFRIEIIDDTIHEDTQQFFVRLITPTGGAALGSITEVTVTILDNDPIGSTPPPTLTPTPPPTVYEASPDPTFASSIFAAAESSTEATATPAPSEEASPTPTGTPAPTPAPKDDNDESLAISTLGNVTDMPETATPWYNYIIVGTLIVLLSGTMLYRRITAFRSE